MEEGKYEKEIITFCLVGTLLTLLTACKKEVKTEYEIDELGQLYQETEELFEKEAQYLTDDERRGSEGWELYEKCSKQTGLPYNQEITLRGIKKQYYGGIQIVSATGDASVDCRFKQGFNNNIGIFIPDGDAIVVKGTISKEGETYGFGALYDISIITPENIDMTYENNVGTIINSISSEKDVINAVIYGKVENALPIEDVRDVLGDYIDFDNPLLSKYICRIDGNDGGTIYFTYDPMVIGELSVGDEIAIQGDVYSILGTDLADGKYVCVMGFIDSVFDCYNFTSEK